jgi:hypothetical protein
MNEYQEFITRAVLDNVNLGNIIKRQKRQLEIAENRNHELEMLVGFLKDKIIEYDPSMRQEFEARKI